MRTSREAHRSSRQMLKLSFTDGRLDQQKVSRMVQTVLSEKPRHYADILTNYQRLVRLEVERRHVVVESAAALNSEIRDQVLSKLKARYGDDLTAEFRTSPALLGGLRIKVGDDVWDGSVRHRLNALQEQLRG
jgi:F-type H+-transporting ATPase subunit delta